MKYSHHVQLAACQTAGMDGYVAKPIQVSDLVRNTQELCSEERKP